MDNIKDDKYYLGKIIADMKMIVAHTVGITEDDLQVDSILCDSVLFRIIQISESTSKLSDEFKALHKNIPWRAIKGMRNRIVHEYGSVNQEIIFTTVTEDIPQALKLLSEIYE